MGIVIGKHINDVFINPLEFVLDDDGEVMEFDSEEIAKDFLSSHGITDLEFIYFKNVKEI